MIAFLIPYGFGSDKKKKSEIKDTNSYVPSQHWLCLLSWIKVHQALYLLSYR